MFDVEIMSDLSTFIEATSFIFSFSFYNSIAFIRKQMENQSEVVVSLVGKGKESIRITSEGIYEVKDQKKSGKRIFTGDSLHLRIQKTEIYQQNYHFMMRIYEDSDYADFIIEDKDTLELLFKLTGKYATIVGLQQLLVSFRKVGEGAFAQVYEAITNYQNRFALKSFTKKTFFQDDKSEEAFHNEIDVMKLLDSPYLVPFSYLFESDKAFYLKMEFFQKTLKERIAQKLSVKKQKQFMRQIVTGLCQLKKKNVIHRDLKPENIMIRRNAAKEEECVIIDFGLATIADAKEYLFFRCGTPGFLAPEIANMSNKKEKQTCASDMFSVGCIFYKMLKGHYLFSGKNAKDVLHNNRKSIYPKNAFQGLSVNEIQLLNKMLQKNPTKRIKPEDALKTPYFKEDVDDEDQIPEQECFLDIFLTKMGEAKEYKNMDSINSSTYSVGSQKDHGSVTSRVYKRSRNQRNSILKDSCLTFEFPANGKDSDSDLLKSTIKSRTPEKTLRQSRFSRLGKDLSNII